MEFIISSALTLLKWGFISIVGVGIVMRIYDFLCDKFNVRGV